jgi:site-specific DNA recombinase
MVKTSKRAGLYARVSSEIQKDNTSPERQLENCRAYCLAKGYMVVTEKIEVASGVLVFARPKFRELLELAEKSKLDIIVCDVPDRLGRGDAIAQLEMLTKLSGATVEYATLTAEPDSLEGIIADSAQGMISQIERYNIRRRTMGGRRKRAEQGNVIPFNFRPYGYSHQTERDERGRIKSCKMILCENEAPIVRMIFEWCAYEMMTCSGIAKRLNEMDTPTPRASRAKWRKASGYWRHNTIRNILRNKTYTGVWHYGKTQFWHEELPNGKKVRHTITLAREDAIPVQVPHIVSTELWKEAQDQLDRNVEKFRKPTKFLYLLRSRLRCALCNTLMVGGARYSDHKYLLQTYRCARRLPKYGKDRCIAAPINAKKIEPVVKDIVRKALTNEKRLFAGIKALQKKDTQERKTLLAMLAMCEAGIQKEYQKLDRYQDLYASNDMTKEQYSAKRDQVEHELQKREKEREGLNDRLNKYQVLDPAREKELREMRREIVKHMDWGSIEQWQKLLEMLRVEVLYNYLTKEVTVSGLIKGKRTLSNTSTDADSRAKRQSNWAPDTNCV